MPTIGQLNVHRMDCKANHPNPCQPWSYRGPRLGSLMKTRMRCSIYGLQECMPQQANDLAIALGWGGFSNPAFLTDENNNALVWDRSKHYDLDKQSFSLSDDVGDLGDRHRRSVIWVLLENVNTRNRIWVGSSHFENGNPTERIKEATILVDHIPTGAPTVLCIDRNSYADSVPARILAGSGLPVLNVPMPYASFHGGGIPQKGQSIDGIHTSCLLISGGQVSTYLSPIAGKNRYLTDHMGLTANISTEVDTR